MKRLLLALLAVLSLGSLAFAQQDEIISRDELRLTGEPETALALSLARPDLFSSVNGSLLLHDLPVLTLLDGRRFPISGNSGRLGVAPLERIPLAFLRAVRVDGPGASPLAGADATGGVVDLRTRPFYSGGEIGLFYGGSGGKYGREDFESYIFGSVGTDNIQFSAGAAYDRSSGHVPRIAY